MSSTVTENKVEPFDEIVDSANSVNTLVESIQDYIDTLDPTNNVGNVNGDIITANLGFKLFEKSRFRYKCKYFIFNYY